MQGRHRTDWSLPLWPSSPRLARVEEELDWRPTTLVRPFPEGAHVKWAPTPVAVLTTLPPALLANIG